MTASCFKIIACGGRDSVDDEPLEASHESKSASDKRGWSFGKRSARHRVLSNTVISETPPALTKDSSASAAVDFQRQPNSTIPDKISAVQWTEEKPQLPTPVDTKLSETIAAEPDDKKADANPDESLVITIQAAIRGFLAQKVLLNHKNIIKLQAVVRGHLVRRHAVGTLRCVQAIIKMQALIRARRARILEEGSRAAEEPNEKLGKDVISPLAGKVNSSNKAPVTYTSIEKLLRNSFARQLLQATPRTKSINIKCDPSKTDSAWKWLERWMSVYSTGNEPISDIVQKDEKKIEHVDSQDETVILPESKSADLNLGKEESESDDNLITYDANRFDVQARRPSSPSGNHNLGGSELQNISGINSEEIILDSLATQQKESDFRHKVEPTISGAANTEGVQSVKGITPEQLDTEGKKFPVGSRKASNPAFLAVQSKFEELSSSAISTKSISSTNQDIGVESYTDSMSSFTDHASRKKESGLAENLVSNNSKVQSGGPDASRVQFGGSECGTELSISSTLDSPDRSDGGANAFEHESKIIKDRKGHPETKEKFEVEAKGESIILASALHEPDAVQPERGITVKDDGADSVMSIDISQVQQMPNTDVSELQMEAETKKGKYKLSPEASPRSHVTVSEPQGTPSSEVSVNPKRTRGEKSGSNRKLKSSSAGKRSPKLIHGSGASSIEQLPKDHKTGKRRNSLGSPKPDLVDKEPRDSSSSNPLPSYMQPTESARAKALLLSSPRSSPDLQDKEVYMKKRHSLPGANGRNGSPHIQRTMSQTQQTVKGEVTQSPQERKWLR